MACIGMGDARPVVILEAGGGRSSVAGEDAQAALPKSMRACAYDRSGSGKSDPRPEPRTMGAEVGDLHSLLEKSGTTDLSSSLDNQLGGIHGRLFLKEFRGWYDPNRSSDENDVVFNSRVNRWITVRELEGPLGEGA